MQPTDLRSLIPEWFEPLDDAEVRDILAHCGPVAQSLGFVRGFFWPFKNGRSPLSVSTPSKTYYGNAILIEADSLILCAGSDVVAFLPYPYIAAVHLLRDTVENAPAIVNAEEFLKKPEHQN